MAERKRYPKARADSSRNLPNGVTTSSNNSPKGTPPSGTDPVEYLARRECQYWIRIHTRQPSVPINDSLQASHQPQYRRMPRLLQNIQGDDIVISLRFPERPLRVAGGLPPTVQIPADPAPCDRILPHENFGPTGASSSTMPGSSTRFILS